MIGARLDRVFTYGDQLSFLIPHEWIEAPDEGGNYLYHAPDTDSGWLRASLLSLRNISREQLHQLLKRRADKRVGSLYESGDNIVISWEQLSVEDGIPICNYWWAVVHYHGPNLSHEALFSYTILRKQHEDPATKEILFLVAKLVADAQFTEPKAA